MTDTIKEDRILPAKISVIICTHNPQPDYLSRALAALETQTLPYSEWELLLIDNASDVPLADIDLSWHPAGRCLREDELGLTPARLRGIAEARGDFIVFVDDDNVLDQDYLAQAIHIGEAHTFLGAWGGTIRPEFEQDPPAWTRAHWGFLAIRYVHADVWSNDPDNWQSQPCGAGLCVRAGVARTYREAVAGDPLRRGLDRRGTSLLSTGDTDLVLTSREVGLGWGNFPALRLTHLIPRQRLTEDYLVRLAEGMTASSTALSLRRGVGGEARPLWRKRLGWARKLVFEGRREARFYWARAKGEQLGRQIVREAEI